MARTAIPQAPIKPMASESENRSPAHNVRVPSFTGAKLISWSMVLLQKEKGNWPGNVKQKQTIERWEGKSYNIDAARAFSYLTPRNDNGGRKIGQEARPCTDQDGPQQADYR